MEKTRITGAADAYRLVAGKLRDGNAASTRPDERLLAIILVNSSYEAHDVVYTRADIRKVEGMSVAIHYAQEAAKKGETAGIILAWQTPFPWPNQEIQVCVSEYRKALKLLGLQLIDVLTINRTNYYSFADEVTREVE